MGDMAEYYYDCAMEYLTEHGYQKSTKIENPMQKFSKVKSVQGAGTWQGNDGTTFYKFDYVFEDGQTLQANHKTSEPMVAVGEMAEYEVTRTHPTYGPAGKVKKPQEFPSGNSAPSGGRSGGDNLLGIKIGHALNCASVLIASGTQDIPQGQEKEALKYWARIVYEASNELNDELSNTQ